MSNRIRFHWALMLAGLVLLGLTSEPSPAQPCFFEDASGELGLNLSGTCGGSIWYDWDNDGDLDMMQCRRYGSATRLYVNDGGHFTLLPNIGLPAAADVGWALPMDYDHDGDVDVFLSAYNSNCMLLANENGSYVDRTLDAGLPHFDHMVWMNWVDFDRDGWMDILFTQGSGYELYRNLNGHFTNVTSQTNFSRNVRGMNGTEADIDLDGDMDLFCGILYGQDFLYVNEGGTLVDHTEASGLGPCLSNGHAVWADFDHDKFPDLLTQGNGRHTIWHNNGDLTFTEMTVHGAATDFTAWPHDAVYAVADFDMDGDYDFYAARPGGCSFDQFAPNQFFICDSMNITTLDIWFHDVAPAWNMDIVEDGVVTTADMDNDGDMDLFISSQGIPTRFYRNLTNSPNRLQVRPLGPTGEQDRWMTRVEVYPHGSSQAIISSEINSSRVGVSGFNNYFVLNQDGHYDLQIYFSSGVVMTPEQYPYLSDIVPSQVGHMLTVRQGQQLETPHEPPATAMKFTLSGTYPNPFNTTTNIRYSVPEDGLVRLSVYNVNGQKAGDLLDGFVAKGEHVLPWNAAGLASGVYLLELRNGHNIAYAKTVLLK